MKPLYTKAKVEGVRVKNVLIPFAKVMSAFKPFLDGVVGGKEESLPFKNETLMKQLAQTKLHGLQVWLVRSNH